MVWRLGAQYSFMSFSFQEEAGYKGREWGREKSHVADYMPRWALAGAYDCGEVHGFLVLATSFQF